MDIYVRFLGLDLVSLHLSTDAPQVIEASNDPGDCTTYPIGFVAANEIPDEAGPYREGWE